MNQKQLCCEHLFHYTPFRGCRILNLCDVVYYCMLVYNQNVNTSEICLCALSVKCEHLNKGLIVSYHACLQ